MQVGYLFLCDILLIFFPHFYNVTNIDDMDKFIRILHTILHIVYTQKHGWGQKLNLNKLTNKTKEQERMKHKQWLNF